MKIGLLLPRSTFYTSISFDIFNGMKSRLYSDNNEEIKVFTENIGFGAEKQLVYRAAEQLIMQHDVDVIFAYIGHSIAQLLRPLFLATNRILIVLDSGANLPQEWPQCDNIVYHSLNNSLGAFHLGKMVQKDGVREVGFSTGYYDGGYLHTYALAKGLERNGVEIKYNLATGYVREQFSMHDLKPYMESNSKKAIVAIFSGDFLQWFFQEMKLHFAKRSEIIYLPPFALEETMLDSTPHPEGILKGIASWSRNLENKANLEFTKTMRAEEKKINLFSLLGWEMGQLIDVLKKISVSGNGRQTVTNLMDVSLETPRGTVVFDSSTKTSYGPLYEVEIVKGKEGRCSLSVSQMLSTKQLFSEMIELELNNAVSGWQNSYVCN